MNLLTKNRMRLHVKERARILALTIANFLLVSAKQFSNYYCCYLRTFLEEKAKSISLCSEVQVVVKITNVDTYQTTRESITLNNC